MFICRFHSRNKRGAVAWAHGMYRSELIPAVFVGGPAGAGAWRVERIQAVRGDPLPAVERVQVHVGPGIPAVPPGGWALRGVAGHARYVERAERVQLDAVS